MRFKPKKKLESKGFKKKEPYHNHFTPTKNTRPVIQFNKGAITLVNKWKLIKI